MEPSRWASLEVRPFLECHILRSILGQLRRCIGYVRDLAQGWRLGPAPPCIRLQFLDPAAHGGSVAVLVVTGFVPVMKRVQMGLAVGPGRLAGGSSADDQGAWPPRRLELAALRPWINSRTLVSSAMTRTAAAKVDPWLSLLHAFRNDTNRGARRFCRSLRLVCSVTTSNRPPMGLAHRESSVSRISLWYSSSGTWTRRNGGSPWNTDARCHVRQSNRPCLTKQVALPPIKLRRRVRLLLEVVHISGSTCPSCAVREAFVVVPPRSELSTSTNLTQVSSIIILIP